jgi:hypothetical protein
MKRIGMDRFPLLTGSGKRKVIGGTAVAVVIALVLYYPIGMLLTHTIDDDINFTPPADVQTEGGSQSVATTVALIEREVRDHRWVANDPFFMAPSALDNMPNFQQGIIGALARFAFELTDQLGRTRGSSQTDPDLQKASGQLQYEGDVWVFDLKTGLLPTVASEKRYLAAAQALRDYNRRLASGNAVFERRGDNLLATLDRITLDLGSSSATIEQHIAEASGQFIDSKADDIFYGIKGQTYAYYMLLNALSQDFRGVIAERDIGNVWSQMLDSLRYAVQLSPWVVVNGDPDSQVQPSHLAAQGFYLLRARTKLREITNILLK